MSLRMDSLGERTARTKQSKAVLAFWIFLKLYILFFPAQQSKADAVFYIDISNPDTTKKTFPDGGLRSEPSFSRRCLTH